MAERFYGKFDREFGHLEKDKSFLEAYVATFQTSKGIHLPRHRLVIVGEKPTVGV